jgi:hypothetical protein
MKEDLLIIPRGREKHPPAFHDPEKPLSNQAPRKLYRSL